MYNAFWWDALFVQRQSYSVKTFDRSRNGCQVISGPSGQAPPLPSHVSFSRARFFLAPTTSKRWLRRLAASQLGKYLSTSHLHFGE